VANTNGLKKIVEPDLINSFQQTYGCELISLSSKKVKQSHGIQRTSFSNWYYET